MQGVRLKPRVSVMAVQLAAGGITVLISIAAATTNVAPDILPWSAVPMLLAIGYMVLPRTPQTVTVNVDAGRLQVNGYERRQLSLQPSEVTRKRWVVPVLGTRQGDALVVRGTTDSGHEHVLTFGAVGEQSATAHDAPWEQVDISLEASDFSTLSTALFAISGAEIPHREAHATFALVPHRGAGAAFGQLLPWFGTMALAGVLGVVGQPLLNTQAGQVVLFGATIALVVGGLVYTIRAASRPKRELVLRVSRAEVSVGELPTPVFQTRRADLRQQLETYVYRTKYGTYRFPVLVLTADTNELRIGVWEDHATVGLPLAPEGPAPHYLISKTELRQLLDTLAS